MDVRYRDVKLGYRVGDDGSVWSCLKHAGPGKCVLTDQWHQLKLIRQRSGHLYVHLGHGDRRSVHVLVLEAFDGPCPPGLECRHFPDRDPANNRIENLHWGTKEQNEADKIIHGTLPKGEKHLNSVLTEKDVLEVLAMRRAGKRVEEIARWFAVAGTTIRHILHGRTWKHVTDVTGLPSGRADKGTMRGEEHGMAVLTEASVVEIRLMRSAGKQIKEIAMHFNVCPDTIWKIVRGKSWKHVI